MWRVLKCNPPFLTHRLASLEETRSKTPCNKEIKHRKHKGNQHLCLDRLIILASISCMLCSGDWSLLSWFILCLYSWICQKFSLPVAFWAPEKIFVPLEFGLNVIFLLLNPWTLLYLWFQVAGTTGHKLIARPQEDCKPRT